MASHVVGASAGAGAGAGGDDGKDDREVRRFLEESARNLKLIDRPCPETCPRCESTDTNFSYYNNNKLTQPKHFCRACKRFWTVDGAIHDVPSGDSLQQEQIMPPLVLDLLLNYPQEVPRWSIDESSVNFAGWNISDVGPPPPPPPPPPPQPLPQPQPQPQPEVVNLNYSDMIIDEDDFSDVLEWSLDELLGSDDDI